MPALTGAPENSPTESTSTLREARRRLSWHHYPMQDAFSEKAREVAISFATPDSEAAREIADRLRRRKVDVYLYLHSPEETLGDLLEPTLHRIYSEASLVIVLFSKHYRTRYTEVELEAALRGKAAQSGIIPVLLDGTELPAALSARGFWSLSQGSDQLITSVLKKLGRFSITLPFLASATLLLTGAAVVCFLLVLGLIFPPNRGGDPGGRLLA